jgi:hypothetical protein
VSQQSMRQGALRAALDAQAVRCKERIDKKRWLEGCSRADRAGWTRRGSSRRYPGEAGGALRAMTDNEGLSVRQAVDWCGAGLTVRVTLRRLAHDL